MKFVIKRSKWYRGRGPHESALLREDGTQCCVGQMCSQIGLADSAILNRKTVSQLINPQQREYYDQTLKVLDRFSFSEAYDINDRTYLTDHERERELKNLVEAAGHEIVFED
jgi:hypothetical protein